MPIYISLLRGINVGGNKKIKMADLRDLYGTLNLNNVQSVLQSGNVVFDTASTDRDDIANTIEQAIESTYGFPSNILLRTLPEWEQIVTNPLFTEEQREDPRKLLVLFLRDDVETAQIDALKDTIPGREIIYHRGRELYIVYPDGMGRSKLDNKFIERRVNTTTTGRNWNTVNKLLTLAQSINA